jgi:integrase
MKFTAKSIEGLQLPAGKSEAVVWDPALPGFGVRLRPTSKSWRIQYRVGRQQRSESLGDVRKISLDEARRIARLRFAQVELGQDPGAERDAARQAALEAELTVGNVATRYLEAKRETLRRSTYTAAVRYLQDYAKPLHAYPLAEVKRAQVAAWVGDLIRKHGRSSARDARTNLSALFSWAMREGLAETNPVIGTNNPGIGTRPRDRVLDDHELRIIWQVCDKVDDDFCRILKLALLTACRRNELGLLRWDEIDLDTGRLTLPGSRTKNHRQHELRLPGPALAILLAQPRQTGREFVFGKRGAGLGSWGWHKARFDALVAEAAGEPLAAFTIHDGRRTAATRLGDIGIAPHVIDALLNHAPPTLHGTYVKTQYVAEKAQALALWAERLLAIVEKREPKVVTLPQRA